LWVLGGATSAFAILAAMSIGVLVLPIAIAIIVFAALRRPRWPEILGLLPGAAAPVVLIAFLHRRRCASAGVHVQFANDAMVIRGHSCLTSFDHQTWMLTGIVIALTGIAAYTFLRRALTSAS
jgi:hypothetical protein